MEMFSKLFCNRIQLINPLQSSQAIQIRFRATKTTRKRRTTHPFKWWVQRDTRIRSEDLTQESKEFVQESVQKKIDTSKKTVEKRVEPWTEDSKRCGLIARKVGVYPMWTKDGRRLLTTLLQINDNHVIKSYTAEEYAKKCIFQQRWRAQGYGCLIVGAEGNDPQQYTAEYCGLFTEAGVAPKKKLTRMLITDDAWLEPGTPLSVHHFRVGDYIDCYAKTIERGFQGTRARWGFKGLPELDTTKARNRPGSICPGRKRAGPPKGKKMAGHMGSEWRPAAGLKIWRINTKHNVLYVNGYGVPGEVGNWVYVFDSKALGKQPKAANPPPFPTYFPDSEEQIPEDIYDPELYQFGDPTIVYVETEEEKKQAKVGAKLAKVRPKKAN